MKPTLRPRPSKWLFLGLMLISISLYGQETIRYTGPFQLGNYVGEVDFSYRLVDGDTLLTGPFSMKRSNLDALLDQKDKTFSFTGSFTDGFPNGGWNFQFGEFESDQKTEVVGYQYRVNVNGIQKAAKGNIKMGKPDGSWSISEELIENSEVKETIFNSQITYADGIPQQSFRIEGRQGTLVGRFLRNGHAHDDWTLYGDDHTETWSFSDGILNTISKKNSNFPIFQSNNRDFRTINLDERFVKILKLQLTEEHYQNVQPGINELLTENAARYKQLNTILSQLGESQFMPVFKVRVPYYPMSSLEQVQANSMSEDYLQADKIAQGLLDNSQLNLLRRSDSEAQFLYSVVQSIHNTFLAPLKKAAQYQKHEVLDYVEGDVLMKRLFPAGRPTTTIQSDEANRTFQASNASDFNFYVKPMESLANISAYAKQCLDEIAAVLYDKVENEQRQQEIIALEEQMIKDVTRLNQLVDTVGTTNFTIDALRHITSTAESQLNSYSKKEQSNEKLAEAKQLVDCIAIYEKLALHISDLPKKDEEIKKVFTDAVWNPFMANVMDEEIKKRITSAYRTILIPFLLEQSQTNLDCEKATKLNQLLPDLHKRMLELREEDTSKLERKLRKEKNPNAILELFNLQPLDIN